MKDREYIFGCEAERCLQVEAAGHRLMARARARNIVPEADHWQRKCKKPWVCTKHPHHHLHKACAKQLGSNA